MTLCRCTAAALVALFLLASAPVSALPFLVGNGPSWISWDAFLEFVGVTVKNGAEFDPDGVPAISEARATYDPDGTPSEIGAEYDPNGAVVANGAYSDPDGSP